MDPLQNAITTLLNAVQAASAPVDLPAPQVPSLMALVGQDVTLIFQGTGVDGQQLTLPSGQTFTAQGAMPYPDGTQLRVRVLGGDSPGDPFRLQILETTPPAPPSILGPLVQGEGSALQARLTQPLPAPELAPLAALYQALKPPPGPQQIQAALDTLPAPSLEILKTVLQADPDRTPAQALASWLQEEDASPSSSGAPAPDASGTALQGLVQRLQAALDRHPELPAAPKEALVTWMKNLQSAVPDAAERKPAPAAAPRGQEVPVPAARSLDASGQLLQALAQDRPSPPEAPETWQAWIKGVVKNLSDPAVSPREAPFHAAQAREGTAYYEIPLPWAPQTPLQLWMESDRSPKGQGGAQGETRTVLLGLSFSRLGETRLGLAKGPLGLQVRVWTEHPELLAAGAGQVEAELQALGASVDLKILPLKAGPGGVPSLRSLVTGPTLQVMG